MKKAQVIDPGLSRFRAAPCQAAQQALDDLPRSALVS
jgi:hypothetical protein